MISHRNVIANTLQITAAEKTWRDSLTPAGGPRYTDIALGLLPFSHIYALVVICHAGPFRGDQVIVLPKFELKSYLSAIQKFKITALFLVSGTNSHTEDTIEQMLTGYTFSKVPPIIITMLRNQDVCLKFDLSSVTTLFTGAAPLGMETAADFQKIYPKVTVRQGYGKH
jgi:acyl-CoA synthetase (AMP-forming)/AMP-acid ligase II